MDCGRADPMLNQPFGDDEDDDTDPVFGPVDADENDEADGDGRVTSPLLSAIPDDGNLDADHAVDQDQDEHDIAARGTASQNDYQEDSDDEEIKKLEAEANVAASDDEDDAGEPASEDPEIGPKPGTADGQLIADIFGDSDSEDEEFEGFKKEPKPDADPSGQGQDESDVVQAEGAAAGSSSSDEDEGKGGNRQSDIVYDFDLMMQKKREENYRRRKRKNTDIINDSDDLIADMITQMKQAAEDDFEYNKVRRPATCKLTLLPRIEDPLRKIDLREALLDSGILSVITDWLTPLPDRSLPNIKVREVMLQVLLDFNICDTDRLKASGIGKAVMYLYKHPKETKQNKARAHRLIQAWSRPIFNNDADFHSITKEEREERDKRQIERMRETQSKRVRTSSESPVKKSSEKTPAPGDKGWVPRARVPQPSARDYVNRPRSSTEVDMGRGSAKKIVTRYDMMQRSFNEKKKAAKTTRAVKISIEGRKM